MKVLLTVVIGVLFMQHTLAQTSIPSDVELGQLYQEATNAKIQELLERIEVLEQQLEEAELNVCVCKAVVEKKELGVPRYINGKLRACKNPNCTDPTCPNKQTSIPPPVNYTTRLKSKSRVRIECRNGVCRKIKD
jgi:hypothetical protein|tara:strand:+ start:7967 stop:8371 length:405 start_codon:yes stop_codon:yes gene_type:complete